MSAKITERFEWAIPLKKEKIQEIWETGILTVDTNVLFDLYRYNYNTSKSILDSLKNFKGRLWISHQVAEEFFRKRAAVICGINQDFQYIQEELKKKGFYRD